MWSGKGENCVFFSSLSISSRATKHALRVDVKELNRKGITLSLDAFDKIDSLNVQGASDFQHFIQHRKGCSVSSNTIESTFRGYFSVFLVFIPMFEDLVSNLLSTYLGDYLEGLSKNDLKISLWKGDVDFKNLVTERSS